VSLICRCRAAKAAKEVNRQGKGGPEGEGSDKSASEEKVSTKQVVSTTMTTSASEEGVTKDGAASSTHTDVDNNGVNEDADSSLHRAEVGCMEGVSAKIVSSVVGKKSGKDERKRLWFSRRKDVSHNIAVYDLNQQAAEASGKGEERGDEDEGKGKEVKSAEGKEEETEVKDSIVSVQIVISSK